ncbi:MAG: hypothetical protein U9Q23_02770 [Candidatus Bipolaricaulota bacterium]|nr:hypothetical protein [Candidatus Bipolaricaulota bacterium]
MLTYKAMYKYLDKGIHGEVLDFPGVITWGEDLEKPIHLLLTAATRVALVPQGTTP